MKQLTFLFFALLLAACGGSDATVATDTTTPAGNDGLGVAITVFAQWQRGSQGNVDGEYDSKEGVFIPCGSDTGVPIKPGDVKIISGGSCDGSGGKMEPSMLVVKRTGSGINVVSRNVTLQEVSGEKGKVQYQTGSGPKQIIVDPATMNRIRGEKTIMEKAKRK